MGSATIHRPGSDRGLQVRDEPFACSLQMITEDGGSAIGITVRDRAQNPIVLMSDVGHGQQIGTLGAGHAQPHLIRQHAVDPRRARAANRVDECGVEAHVGVHDGQGVLPRHIGEECVGALGFGGARAAQGQFAHHLRLDALAGGVDVRGVCGPELGDARALVRAAREQPCPHQRLDRGSHGGSRDAVVRGCVDLPERLSRCQGAGQNPRAQVGGDGVDDRHHAQIRC